MWNVECGMGKGEHPGGTGMRNERVPTPEEWDLKIVRECLSSASQRGDRRGVAY